MQLQMCVFVQESVKHSSCVFLTSELSSEKWSSCRFSVANNMKQSYCNWLNSRWLCAPFKAGSFLSAYRYQLTKIHIVHPVQLIMRSSGGGPVTVLRVVFCGFCGSEVSSWLWTRRCAACRAVTRHKRHFKIRCEGWRICRNPLLIGFQTTSNCGLEPVCYFLLSRLPKNQSGCVRLLFELNTDGRHCGGFDD